MTEHDDIKRDFTKFWEANGSWIKELQEKVQIPMRGPYDEIRRHVNLKARHVPPGVCAICRRLKILSPIREKGYQCGCDLIDAMNKAMEEPNE